MTADKRPFQAEVSKLLHIVANSLYSEREVFLRELISNASDACDKLRYLALTEPALVAGDPEYKIRIAADAEAGTLTISDNGIGMTESDLDGNLGTIARSGTGAFVENLSGDATKDVGLIGQFGVGFYSAFMVSHKVEVLSRRAGEETAWLWSSDGLGDYEIAPAEKAMRGTIVTLHLKDDAEEFLEESRLRTIVKTYSDHIPIPILFGSGDDEETLNEASALWMRAKSEISDEQYREFYRHVSHSFDEPWSTTHWRAEGRYDYSALLYVPSNQPFDLFHPDRKHRVKLYVKRVLITEHCADLVPQYLRFITGVIDCEDLPLNVSRELLQKNPMLSAISNAVAKRVLNELTRAAEKDSARYDAFWDTFGAVLKEGLYGVPTENREALMKLLRFRSSARDGLVSLEQYVNAMKNGQEKIFYITGESQEAVRNSPHLEGFAAKGVEVLLLSDPIDDFWITSLYEGYESKSFQSVTRGFAALDAIVPENPEDTAEKADDEKEETDLMPLVASIKLTLGDKVKDVRESGRLTDSACCLVADDGDMDTNLERILRQHRQITEAAPRVLEINPSHPLIRGLARRIRQNNSASDLADAAFLLLDQARIMDGEAVFEPKAFAQRMSRVMELGLVD